MEILYTIAIWNSLYDIGYIPYKMNQDMIHIEWSFQSSFTALMSLIVRKSVKII